MDYYLWGLQRSGTNYLKDLIEQNLNAKCLNRHDWCWKHSIDQPKEFDPKSGKSIVITKNPYTWVESIAFRKSVDWTKRQKTYPASGMVSDDNAVGPRRLDVEALAKTYAHFIKTWIMDNPDSYHVRYEHLLETRYRVMHLEKVEKLLNTKKSNSLWINPPIGSTSQSFDMNYQRIMYYLDQKPQQLTIHQTQIINKTIGREIFNKLGYTII